MKLPKIIENLVSKIKGSNRNPQKLNPGTEGVILFGADNIPAYKSLSHEDKKKVDEYVKKIKPENLKDIIQYGEEVGKKSTTFADMLVNLFQQISENTDEASGSKFTKRPLEEILELRLNTLLAAKQLTIYRSAIEDLSNKARLQTVALEKVKQNRKNHILDVINIFAKSDIGRGKIEDGQLDAAIDRMRISAQIAANQIQTVANSKDSMEMMKRAIEVYKAIVPENDDRVPEIEKKLLEDKKTELLTVAKVVLPDKKFYDHPIENEEDEIEELARIQMELEIYAQTHKNEIDKIRTRIKEINTPEGDIKAKDKLLEEIEIIKIKYKVFGRRIDEEDWKNFYQAKLAILTLDINEKEDTPFKDAEFPKDELEWYKKIVDDKIQKLMTGENPELKRKIPDKKHLSAAIKIIKKILQLGERNFNPERILQEAYPLKLLLAFDRKDGLGKMTLKKQDIDADFVDEWADLIPLHSIYLINTRDYNYEIYTNSINVDDNVFVQLYKLYAESEKKIRHGNEDFRWPTWEEKVHIVPEGIIAFNEPSTYHGSLDCNKIVFPATARNINTTRYGHNNDLYVVEFNEGLERIGDYAFQNCLNIGRYTGIKFPATLRTMGAYAFYDCPHIGPPNLNEGLEEIGEKAFWFNELKYEKNDDQLITPTTCMAFPSTIKKTGPNVVNMHTRDGCVIGFRNYKGQEIPENILRLILCDILPDPEQPKMPAKLLKVYRDIASNPERYTDKHRYSHGGGYPIGARYNRDDYENKPNPWKHPEYGGAYGEYSKALQNYIKPTCNGIQFSRGDSLEPYSEISIDEIRTLGEETYYKPSYCFPETAHLDIPKREKELFAVINKKIQETHRSTQEKMK